MDAREGPDFARSSFDRNYWLSHCERFRVEARKKGRAGIVEHVRFQSRQDRPDVLAVRAGLFGRRILLIPVEEVEMVVPRQKRLLLRGEPRIVGTESS